ncbi:RHS repeat domain-containing protein, partial [Porphyromonas macacae]
VSFEYDPLGRRISKRYKGTTTRWVWDGNVPLHEWTNEEDITTWVFEEGTFVPTAKIVGNKAYSIITDYPGTPTEMYNSKGKKTWSAELDIYGCVRTFRRRSLSDCPFRYQGQYFDSETELCYNRYRYYDPSTGAYISQDPIGLAGDNPTIYGYVFDNNTEIDPFGLECWKTAREKFWKAEAEANPHKYSPDNLSRMADGKSPRMTVEVFNRKTGKLEIKDVSIELHHTYLPQRNGGNVINEAWNLTPVSPWTHASMDPYRYTGDSLIRIIKGTNSWIK